MYNAAALPMRGAAPRPRAMCFDQKSSFGFAGLGLFFTYWVYSRSGNVALSSGIFFFFLMEFLQGIQYFFIDECDNQINQILTVVGFLHICLQPYFTHVINSALTKNPITLAQFSVVKKLCLIGGGMLFARYLFHASFSTMNISPNGPCGISTEWLRGEKLCTFRGKYHLAWSVPMADPTYIIPGAGIHSFLMFAPFFVMKQKMAWIQGVFLFLTGPYLASVITPNLMEQASIWCFFSIAQIGVMLFLIRSTLTKGPKDAEKKKSS